MTELPPLQSEMASALPLRTPKAPSPPELRPPSTGTPFGAPQQGRPGRWVLGIALALVAGLAGYIVSQRVARRSPSGAANGVRTAKAVRGDLRHTLRLNGTIGAKEFAAIVAPRLSGRQGGGGGDSGGSQMILVKLAKPGSLVKKGDVVAEFDRQWQMQRVEDQHAELMQSEAAVAKRRAELDVLLEAARQSLRSAKADSEKAKLDLGTVEIRSQIDAEKLKLAVDETAARSQQLEQEIRLTEASQKAEIRALEFKRDRAKIDKRRAQFNAERMVMRAPINGIVVMQMTFRAGQMAQVQEGDQLWPGMPFMQIVNPASMLVNAVVNQVECQDLRLGQTAEIRLDAYPAQVWPGRLVGLGAMASGSVSGVRGGSRALYVKQMPVRLLIEARDPRIIPDLSASATVLLKEEKNAVIAPRQALEEENGSFYVQVKGPGGGWEKRRLHLGLTNETYAAVRAGLNVDEEVALERLVRAGQ